MPASYHSSAVELQLFFNNLLEWHTISLCRLTRGCSNRHPSTYIPRGHHEDLLFCHCVVLERRGFGHAAGHELTRSHPFRYPADHFCRLSCAQELGDGAGAETAGAAGKPETVRR